MHPTGRSRMPPISASVFPCLNSDRIIMPPVMDSRANMSPRENQTLLIVLQNIQQITLSSGSPKVIGWGVHHMRQQTRQMRTMPPLISGESQPYRVSRFINQQYHLFVIVFLFLVIFLIDNLKHIANSGINIRYDIMVYSRQMTVGDS